MLYAVYSLYSRHNFPLNIIPFVLLNLLIGIIDKFRIFCGYYGRICIVNNDIENDDDADDIGAAIDNGFNVL